MVLTKSQLTESIRLTKLDISGKNRDISRALKETDFRGVRIQDQFDVGRQGIKRFRKLGKARRAQAFKDLGLFNKDLVGLKAQLNLEQSQLDELNIGGL